VEGDATQVAAPTGATSILEMRSMAEYPSGLIGTISALFGKSISQSHGVDWTLDAMIAEQQCAFFRRFNGNLDRVWIVMQSGWPKGALTVDGPRLDEGREAARLRFFILHESLRGRGLGASMLSAAMQFCQERKCPRVFLTTLPGLDAATKLYQAHGFTTIEKSEKEFHGSRFGELTMECHLH